MAKVIYGQHLRLTDQIRRELKNKKISQQDLATRIGVSPQTLVHRFQLGNWTAEELIKTVHVLGMEVVIGGENESF